MFVGYTQENDKGQEPTVRFRTSTYDMQIKKYIEAEEAIKIVDVQCESCSKSYGCKNCKNLNAPVTAVQLEESQLIRDAINVNTDPNDPNKRIISIEYPVRPGVDLNQQYTDYNSNVEMAKKSSQSLQKRLQKLNLLTEFHEQIIDGLQKGHIIEIN